MGKIFKDNVSVLFDEDGMGEEFNLYECGYEECRPTKPYEFKPIDYWVIHYCLHGEGFFQIREKQNHIHPGDIFMIPPNTKNKYFPSSENPWVYRWVGLRGTGVQKILAECNLSADSCVIHHKVDGKLESLFEKVYQALKDGHRFAAVGNVYQLIDYLENNVRNVRTDQLTPGETHFQAIITYIGQNYFNDIAISDLAGELNIDRTYIYKLFKKYKNISPSRYIQQYRLDKACILLRKSALNVTDIGYAVGFQYPTYFSRLFTEYFGVSPSEYRKDFIQFGEN